MKQGNQEQATYRLMALRVTVDLCSRKHCTTCTGPVEFYTSAKSKKEVALEKNDATRNGYAQEKRVPQILLNALDNQTTKCLHKDVARVT